ncbi:MAG: helix-turn-helix domain-containing protein [Clostridia bacterium]|nr:helix-turn-helix domain-containing protein [Clostridia bacterium]
MNQHFSANLRRLRLDKGLTQEQTAAALGVSAQSVSRWETSTTLPDVMLLPEIARLYGVLVDELFRPDPRGYANNAQRLLAVFERTHKPEDFLAAQQEFRKLLASGNATADDWRSNGVTHEYMVYQCIDQALASYGKGLEISRDRDDEMYHRIIRQRTLLRSRIGQGAACVAELEETTRQHPDDPDVRADLAHALSCAALPERTLEACREALERFPDSAMLHLFAGDACRTLRQYDDAFAHWETTLRLDDRFTDAMFSMAFCREELGQYAQAAELWEAISRKLDQQGLEIEARWPKEMAENCRIKAAE